MSTTVLSFLGFEDDTVGAPPGLANRWSSYGTGRNFVVSTSAAVDSAQGVSLVDSTSLRRLQYSDPGETEARVLSCDLTLRALPGQINVVGVTTANGSESLASWRVNASGRVALRDGTEAVDSSDAGLLEVGTTYRVEWRVEPGVSQTLRVYDTSDVLLDELTGAMTATSWSLACFGLLTDVDGTSLDLDNVRVSDGWIVGETVVDPDPDDTDNTPVKGGGPATTSLTFQGFAVGTRLASATMPTGWKSEGNYADDDFQVVSAGLAAGKGARLSKATHYRQLTYTFSQPQSDAIELSAWLELRSPGDVPVYPFGTARGQQAAYVRINTDRTLCLRDSSVTVATTTWRLSVGRKYLFRWTVEPGTTARQRLRVYDASGAMVAHLVGAYTRGRVPRFRVGALTAPDGATLLVDSVKIGTPVALPGVWTPVSWSGFSGGSLQTLTASSAGSSGSSGSGTTDLGPIGFVGDSLTYQDDSDAVAESLADARFLGSRVDGLIGRPISADTAGTSSLEVISSWRDDGFDPRYWCVPLGANERNATDSQWRTHITEVLDAIASGDRSDYVVLWPGLVFSPDVDMADAVGRFNALLDTIAGERTDLTLLGYDMDAAIHDGRDESGLWLSSDTTGRHMTAAGYAVRNQVVTAALTAHVPA
ncbi:SGNH/GDSL hydrolase family protein [Nocardioides sp. GY 10127]|uniref:SGNH/GDSL hydrolase family protein n=1 Tax=Nocardioides sp. GY 10127 TaxID=2569762 RepID=UPI0010A895ED|nr:SGNH/GDSL hydrolase family protein [Nocardioides sp. GY 10127]TIC81960.1 hypothetical protein E8D37_12465 [Nocardioides sp. GY 10127]